jgi:outer membrane autotransporter protein
MPSRHWLSAVACLAILACGSAPAWAHSNAGSEKTTTTTVLRDVASQLIGNLAGRTNQLGSPNGTFTQTGAMNLTPTSESGRSGAVALKDTALWANASYTSLKNDNAFTAYDGPVISTMIGIDTRVIDPLTVGVAFGYEHIDLDTTFNQGHYSWDGYSVTPYAVFRFLNNYSIDVSGSYGRLNNDVDRLNNAAKGSFDSDRWTAAANLNGGWNVGKWRLGATVGYLYMHQDDEAYNEVGLGNARVAGQTTEIGQGRAGVQVGYDLGKIEPYLKGRVEHEFTSPGRTAVAPGVFVSPDNTGYVLGAGAVLRITDQISGGLEATTTQGRDHQDIWGVSGTIRFRF